MMAGSLHGGGHGLKAGRVAAGSDGVRAHHVRARGVGGEGLVRAD